MNAYETLGVSRTAPDAEVRKAFQRIAKVHHPDASPSVEEALAVGDIDWEAAQAAYEELKTPEKRAAYDAKLLALAPRCPRCKGTKAVQQLAGWKVVDMDCPDCDGTGKKL